jgi:hypothetical protein
LSTFEEEEARIVPAGVLTDTVQSHRLAENASREIHPCWYIRTPDAPCEWSFNSTILAIIEALQFRFRPDLMDPKPNTDKVIDRTFIAFNGGQTAEPTTTVA